MLRIGHASDVHLDCAPTEERERFYEQVRSAELDYLIVTGDIAEGGKVYHFLTTLLAKTKTQLLFVLGNHDFYGSSIASSRAQLGLLVRPPLVYLPAAGIVALSDQVAVVGVDGFADGRNGNLRSRMYLEGDWNAIEEIARPMPGDTRKLGRAVREQDTHPPARGEHVARGELLCRLRALGDAEAAQLRPRLLEALARFSRVLVATHVPPWPAAAWHRGVPQYADALPWYTCKAVGDLIDEVSAQHPESKLTVLCGHTHGRHHGTISDGIECRTAGAEYGRPQIDSVIEL